VAEGKFREDLFHRLNVIRMQLPPLRERPGDIPRLTRHFLQKTAKELGTEAKSLHPDTEALLMQLPWSGNVRQLENVCRWLTVRRLQTWHLNTGQLVGISRLTTRQSNI
jgi:two-component system nitrogen regulation response regulator GlnG